MQTIGISLIKTGNRENLHLDNLDFEILDPDYERYSPDDFDDCDNYNGYDEEGEFYLVNKFANTYTEETYASLANKFGFKKSVCDSRGKNHIPFGERKQYTLLDSICDVWDYLR